LHRTHAVYPFVANIHHVVGQPDYLRVRLAWWTWETRVFVRRAQPIRITLPNVNARPHGL
jgi:hypothetical protein